MIKNIICEISESDFRKLNLIGKRMSMITDPHTGRSHYGTVDVSLNHELDEQIATILDGGWPDYGEFLKLPVAVAIHEDGDGIDGMYLDKYLNRFSGPQTFQIGLGIKHLYSTRNWLECRDGDYWRVNKKETRAVYMVRLDPKWAERFVLKHRESRTPWDGPLPDGISPDGLLSCELVVREDLMPDGTWKEFARACEAQYGNRTVSVGINRPVDEAAAQDK